MERPLSDIERSHWALDQISCCNLVVVARVSGPLSDAALRSALRRVQLRHPLLQTHVAIGDKNRPMLVTNGTKRANARTIDHVRGGQVEAGWHHQAEFEMNTPFKQGQPLFRAVSIRPIGVGDGSNTEGSLDLLLTFGHTIVDPEGGALLLHEVLSEAGDRGTGGEAAPERPPFDDMLPRGGGSGTGSFRLWNKPKKLEPDMAVPPEQRMGRVIHLELKPNEVERLEARCAQEGASLHGALFAALAVGVARDLGDHGTTKAVVSCASARSLREKLKGDIGAEVGNYASSVSVTVKPSDGAFWDVAKDADDQLQALESRGEAIAAARSLGKIAPKTESDFDKFLKQHDKRSQGNTGIYHLRSVSIPEKVGPFQIRKLHVCTGVPCTEALQVAVTAHRRWLLWNLCYSEGFLSPERAERLAERSLGTLREAMGKA